MRPRTLGSETASRGDGRSLRQRILVGILAVTALTVGLFAVPLAAATNDLYRSEELARLQADATRVAAMVPDNPITARNPGSLPAALPRDTVVGLYSLAGARAVGSGPVRSALAGASRDGGVHEGTESGQLAVAVPVPSDNEIVAIVRAAVPSGVVASRTYRSWLLMGLLALAALLVAALLARRQAQRIADPLERLTVTARALGDGNFAVQAQHSGIPEADAVSQALEDTAGRIGRLIERERAFSADASHQLRTPLTGLLLGLESALDRPNADLRTAVSAALDRGRHLQDTISDLLSLRRDVGERPSVDVVTELQAAQERWSSHFGPRRRRIDVSVAPALPPAAVSAAALRQILDVLLANALEHGAGTVSLSAHDLGAGVAAEVGDEGEGLRGDPEAVFARRSAQASGFGIGLALARSLAEAEQGRLIVRRAAPHPVFAILLPAAETVAVPLVPAAPDRQPSSS
jgi:signal transduction histidine kinase